MDGWLIVNIWMYLYKLCKTSEVLLFIGYYAMVYLVWPFWDWIGLYVVHELKIVPGLVPYEATIKNMYIIYH